MTAPAAHACAARGWSVIPMQPLCKRPLVVWREFQEGIVSAGAIDLELMLAWNRAHCRPPLPDNAVAQTVQSIARVHERGSSDAAASEPSG